MTKQSALIAIIALLGLCTLTSASEYTLDLTARKVVDANGRFVINHGVNAVVKLPPFYPVTDRFDSNLSLADADFQNLRAWGVNSIRLMLSWEATNIEFGLMNITYLKEVRKIVRSAAKYDISIILDAHEDTVARRFCGEGFPDWTIRDANKTFPFPKENVNLVFDPETGLPTLESCLGLLFFLYNESDDVQYAWQKLYDNIDGIQDQFADFWKTAAIYFKDEPNVLGYEIMNEFYTANMKANSSYSNATNNDIAHLTPLYDHVNARIREIDQKTIIFFEPTVTDPAVGLERAPGGAEYSDRSIFSFHVYCGSVTPEGEPKNITFCNEDDTRDFHKKFDWAEKMGLVSSLTEFGALSNSDLSGQEVTFLTNLTESYFVSWYYWQFKYYLDLTTAANPADTESFYFNDGTLQATKVKALARSYVHRICGSPISTEFNATTGILKFSYTPKAEGCNGKNTEVYLSEDYYPGYTAAFEGCSGCKLVPINATEKYYYEIQVSGSFDNVVSLTASPATTAESFDLMDI